MAEDSRAPISAGSTPARRPPGGRLRSQLSAHDRWTTKAKTPHRPAGAPKVTYAKVSVTIPEAVLAEVRARAPQGGLSAYLTAAAEASLASDRLRDLIAELDAEHGPVPESMVAEAEAVWPDHT